ncbi:hypothetical protein DWX94_03475 [Coprococcus eutactus]|uniref:Uncharacterized protein n=1 Tax=Coprococcus eutactus TaxID=33043 RepID=A0A412IU54_9FIRM|nr:hypothetical protein DWX94_03475 [Coprococcus eutactus]
MGNETAVREKLRSGGELVICGGDVRIEYFFPGPDRRYGGSRLMISGRDIPEYIELCRITGMRIWISEKTQESNW